MIEHLTLESFLPHVGTSFDVTVQGYDEVLTLVDAEGGKHETSSEFRQPFRLLLRGSRKDLYINQGSLELRHPVMGTMMLDMSPIGKCDDGTFEYYIGFS
ncbi:hypothetical protein P1X14_13480 [Sphingomonas sp. AOB5]|uniref:DUF6916 family protein n=1 Tax=Sphingomonas sp. AOB5 TaxID=3034017 RepID=UPI0023F9617B|nr:hypothetical protein [Sphingomonas sp. AOB5]MDF7776262.1 hypothetical protein [Sphingomonas sp. AOB5]